MGSIHPIYTDIQIVYTKTKIKPKPQISANLAQREAQIEISPLLANYLIVIIYCLLFNSNLIIVNQLSRIPQKTNYFSVLFCFFYKPHFINSCIFIL